MLTGATPAGLWAAAAVLGLLFVGEAVYGWLTFQPRPRGTTYDDEEDEGE